MTEMQKSNRDVYLDLCKTVYNFDEASLKYVEKRTSDEWQPEPEFEELFRIPNSTYEDQRIRINLDMKDKDTVDYFSKDDESWSLFKELFKRALAKLEKEGCPITYGDFILNKIKFRKNETKIKKVLEIIYSENPREFEKESGRTFSKENCADYIVKSNEKIGAGKKSAKNKQLVISFNPIDWYLSSAGEKSWSSCFDIAKELHPGDNGYEYSLGLPFLCGDRNRFLLYITDGSKKTVCGITTDHYETRSWCILDVKDIFAIVKWYPNKTVGLGPIISITKNNKFKTPSEFSRGMYPIDVLTTKAGHWYGVYSDMGGMIVEDKKLYLSSKGNGGGSMFTKNLKKRDGNNSIGNFHEPTDYSPVRGRFPHYSIANWKKFGINIDNCTTQLRCNCCGQVKGAIATRKAVYCYDCYDTKLFTCFHCGNEAEIEKKNSVKINGKMEDICEDCAKLLKKCDICGGLSIGLAYTADKKNICSNCLTYHKHGYAKCDCGTISNTVHIMYNQLLGETFKNCMHCSPRTIEREETPIFGRRLGILKRTVSEGVEIE